MREITTKYHSDHRKHRYELVDKPKKQCNKISIDAKLAIKVIMDSRTTSAHIFFSIIIFNKQTNKTKNITITRYYFVFQVSGKKGEK